MSGAALRTATLRGWEVVRLQSDVVEVDVVPGKGADVVALRWRPLDLDVLWHSPWGLRAFGAVPTGADAAGAFMESYPGGWQMILPNGGDPCAVRGVEQGFHGEASLAAWDWRAVDSPSGQAVELTTHLARSPLALRRLVRLDSGTLHVADRVENTGGTPYEVMWSHHPAFGAPFLSGDCTLDCAASGIVVDAERDTPTGDLLPGGRGEWPHAPARSGAPVDLRRVPPDGPPVDRFAYLTGFDRGHAAVTNPRLGLRVALDWDARVFPYAWYWLEARATADHPWYQQAYVLAVEPATSFPGHGIDAVRASGGSLLSVAPGAPVETEVRCTLGPPGDGV